MTTPYSEVTSLLEELTEVWGLVTIASLPAMCEVSDMDGRAYQAPTLLKALRLASGKSVAREDDDE